MTENAVIQIDEKAEHTSEPKVRYEVVGEYLYSPEIGEYFSYGIAVFEGNAAPKIISDVSVEKEPLEELCRRCADEGLDPIHIYDIIEDFLSN